MKMKQVILLIILFLIPIKAEYEWDFLMVVQNNLKSHVPTIGLNDDCTFYIMNSKQLPPINESFPQFVTYSKFSNGLQTGNNIKLKILSNLDWWYGGRIPYKQALYWTIKTFHYNIQEICSILVTDEEDVELEKSILEVHQFWKSIGHSSSMRLHIHFNNRPNM